MQPDPKTAIQQDYLLSAKCESIEQVKELNASKGFFFFSNDACRYFKSRVSEKLYAGCIFVTSEQFQKEPRRYTVRVIANDGQIYEVGDFQQFLSSEKAHQSAFRNGKMLEGGFVLRIRDRWMLSCDRHPNQ
jgi:hypothetical protein